MLRIRKMQAQKKSQPIRGVLGKGREHHLTPILFKIATFQPLIEAYLKG